MLHSLGEPGDVANSIYLTQRDVRELQFAKAAIATGWHVLLDEAGLTAGDIQQVLLAGIVRQLPVTGQRDRARPRAPAARAAGRERREVAGEGAKMALLSIRERAAALALLGEVKYVELSDRDGFNDAFVDQLQFPSGRRS